jgi:hypothetical protein
MYIYVCLMHSIKHLSPRSAASLFTFSSASSPSSSSAVTMSAFAEHFLGYGAGLTLQELLRKLLRAYESFQANAQRRQDDSDSDRDIDSYDAANAGPLGEDEAEGLLCALLSLLHAFIGHEDLRKEAMDSTRRRRRRATARRSSAELEEEEADEEEEEEEEEERDHTTAAAAASRAHDTSHIPLLFILFGQLSGAYVVQGDRDGGRGIGHSLFTARLQYAERAVLCEEGLVGTFNMLNGLIHR